MSAIIVLLWASIVVGPKSICGLQAQNSSITG